MAIDIQEHLRSDFTDMLTFNCEWTSIHAPEYLAEMKRRGYSETEAREFFCWLIKRHSDIIATVKVSERFLTMHYTDAQIRKRYLRIGEGPWISHIRVHHSIGQALGITAQPSSS